MVTPTVRVLYSCAACGLKKAAVDVPARAPDEALGRWMERLRVLLSLDHRRRSQACEAVAMDEVYIPMTGTSRVGGPTVQ